MASAGGSVSVLFVFRLPAVLVPGRDRLRQAHRRAAAAGAAAAAAVAGAVAAEAADHKHPAFFLFARALRPWLPHQEAA